jgi:hypothetical protein
MEVDNMSLVQIGDKVLKTPSDYNALSSDIVDSGRNIEGYVVSDVIRYDVAKVEMSWRYLTVKEWSDMLKLFNPDYGGSFINTVTYFDQCTGKMRTKRMYVSDRTAGMWRRNPDTGEVMGYTDCSLSLVEV